MQHVCHVCMMSAHPCMIHVCDIRSSMLVHLHDVYISMFFHSRDAYNVSEADALDYVLGYTIGNDVSARDWQLNAEKR